MDQEKLIATIVDTVLQILQEEKKLRILALFSAGITGLEDGIHQLKYLQNQGHTICTALTPNAKQLFAEMEDASIREYLFSHTTCDRDLYAKEYPAADVILIPVLTKNTVAKAAAGISDNVVTRLIQMGIMNGKRIIAAENACKFDTERYQGCPAKYQNLFAKKLEDLADYGVEFTDVSRLAARVSGGQNVCQNEAAVIETKLLDAQTVGETAEKQIILQPGTIVTPLAKDLARKRGIAIRFKK